MRKQFPQVQYLQQYFTSDFKNLTEKAINFQEGKYILFAVDDLVVTRPIHFEEAIALLELHNTQGFYLRLGKNITECYTESKKTGRPKLTQVISGVYAWKFNTGRGDCDYPPHPRYDDISQIFYQTTF